MKIILKKIIEVNGELKIEEEVYAIPHATGAHYRQLLKFDETIDYSNMNVEDHDEVVGFVCNVFRNQFTVDEFYEGIPAHETIDTIINVFAFVRTGKTPEQLKEEQEQDEEKNS